MSANLSSHLYDLMLETERLRERLGVEKYTHYLCHSIDRILERYHRSPERCYREVAKLLLSEWNVDGVFIEQPGELSLCLDARGDETDASVLMGVASVQANVQKTLQASQSDQTSVELPTNNVLGDWLAVPLFHDAEDTHQLVCIIGVYRLPPRERHQVERRRYHRYQPALESGEFNHEDRQLIVETRERMASRSSGSLLKLGRDILVRCSDLTGVDNYLVTQLVRRDDLEIHLGRRLTQQVLRDPDYQAKLAPRAKTIGHLFCDIVGFSAYTRQNRKNPRLVMTMLNDYFAAAQVVIERYPNALLDKYIGDCLVILIGAFDEDETLGESSDERTQIEQYALTGVELGAELIRAATNLGQEVSVGFHIGPSLLGFVGPPDKQSLGPVRVDFTAISDHMNIAARLQAQANPSELVISADVQSILFEHSGNSFGEARDVELKNIGTQQVYGLFVQ